MTVLSTKVNNFLEGSDTDTIINKWKELEVFLSGLSESDNLVTILGNKANKATTLAGYGITDAYTKTNVDNLLKAYVTLAGNQTIEGVKDFTGGLKVNGSPIVYDSRGFWKLEGDLIVTGGVTMYSSDTAFTPSTIMDAIVVDGTTISKEGGVLKVVGSTGGGAADSVSWRNILDKPSWITDSAPIIGISGVNVSLGSGISQSSLRTALGLGSNAYSSTAYLPLTGGTLSGQLTLDHDYGANSNIIFKNNRLSSTQTSNTADNVILINDATNATVGRLGVYGTTGVISYMHMGLNGYNGNNLRVYKDKVTFGDSQLAYLTSNVASATKLKTARTIWGQSFDGTANIDGKLILNNNIALCGKATDGTDMSVLQTTSSNNLSIGLDVAAKGYSTYISGNSIYLRYGTSRTTGITLDSGGITRLASNLVLENDKAVYIKNSSGNSLNILYVDSSNVFHIGYATSGSYNTKICGNNLYLCYGSRSTGMILNNSGNITIGSSDLAGTTYKMYVDGNPAINGTITKYNTDKTYRFGISHYNNEARLYNIIDDGSVYGNIRIGTSNSNCIFFDGVNYRLGIKTTTPDYTLDVNGVINTNNNIYAQTTSNTARQIKVSNDVASMSLYVSANGNKGLYDTANSKWFVYTNGTNTFLPIGNVGIGTTSPAYILDVNGIAAVKRLVITDTNSGKQLEFSRIGANSITTPEGGHLRIITNGKALGDGTADLVVNNGLVTVNGNILATGGVTMYSARKLKNITDERGLSLEELSVIKPTRFTWKDNRDNKIHIGGIADDVMKVLPEVIYKTGEDDTLTMDYGNAAFAISASLIKPVVNHEERIRLLEEENKRLKEEIEQLKWNIA